MADSNYFTLVSKIIQELLSHPSIHVEKFAVKSGYSLHYLNDLETRLNLTMAEPVKSFYQQLSEVEISWYFKEPDPGKEATHIYGEIYLQDINKCLGLDNYDKYWLTKFKPASQAKNQDFLASFKPIDYFNSEDTEIAGMLTEGDVLTDKIAYYKQNTGFVNLGINLSQYLDYLKETRGLSGWQEAVWLNKYDDFMKKTRKIFAPEKNKNLK